MISTQDLSGLPDLAGFRRLTKSLAMLDAILSPEWDFRYYSFNAHWSAGEMMASMRNGSGDHWFAILCADGVALHGLAHEAPNFRQAQPWPGIFEALPAAFTRNLLREPAFVTADSTFCIWRLAGDDRWMCGDVELPAADDPDGSRELLSILSGEPQDYVEFAQDYYETEIDPADVAAVYAHAPLSDDLVRRLNPEASLAALAGDIKEIGYPDTAAAA